MSCCCLTSVIGYLVFIPAILFLLKFLFGKWKASKLEKMLNRWNSTPKDVIILHGFAPGKTLPSPSPYILKAETYLRMAGLKYELDDTEPFGPKGKTPWISVNGEHVADSQHIIEFLSKKFEKNFSHNIDKEALAVSTMARIMLEEHFIWGVALERIVFGGRQYMDQVLKFPAAPFLMKLYLRFIIKRRSKTQGIGLHSEEEIVQFMKKDLIAISHALGNKKYICGDTPSEDDCGIFGSLAQVIWGLPNSPYEKLVKGELKNLEEYCIRMKEKFWPDWDKVIRP